MVIIAAAIAIVLLMGYSKPSQIRHVTVSWPENQTTTESRSCVLEGDDPVSKLQHLNCDLPAPDKLRSPMFVWDVKFATTPERSQYVEWTCQRTNNSLLCEN